MSPDEFRPVRQLYVAGLADCARVPELGGYCGEHVFHRWNGATVGADPVATARYQQGDRQRM